MKERALLILLLFGSVHALTCAADNMDKPGTCISATYSFFGQNVYKACYHDPYYDSGSKWPGYEVCYATIRTGSLTSDAGSLVADAWSLNNHQLTSCASYNGAACDVFPSDGFSGASASDQGNCDASEANCVKCSGSVELYEWVGGGVISGPGDGLCESGCGAEIICDEISNDNGYTGVCVGPREQYCVSDCTSMIGTCEADFPGCTGDVLCDELDTGDWCADEYCENGLLFDFNDNQVLDSAYCTGDCVCNITPASPLVCDTECDASLECNNQEIGYHKSNVGCNTTCLWDDCGLYEWNTTSCYTSCNSNNECYSPGVCDLVGDFSNECVVDEEEPFISIVYPLSIAHINESIVEFNLIDSVDALLDCEYSIDNGSPQFLGSYSLRFNSDSFSVLNGFRVLNISCVDDSGNLAYSNHEEFLFDDNGSRYFNNGWTNVTLLESNVVTYLDDVSVNAFWTDDHFLNESVLWTNRSGVWVVEDVFAHNGSPSGWSNFTLDLIDDGDKTFSWKIVTNDSAGNHNETEVESLYVYNATIEISVELNTTDLDLLWKADAQPTTEASPNNTFSDSFIGDLRVNHDGIGLPINVSFWLNQTLDSDFTMKLNDEPDYSTAVDLTIDPQEVCNEVQPGTACEVWVWLDWNGETSPGLISGNKIEMESYFS